MNYIHKEVCSPRHLPRYSSIGGARTNFKTAGEHDTKKTDYSNSALAGFNVYIHKHLATLALVYTTIPPINT